MYTIIWTDHGRYREVKVEGDYETAVIVVEALAKAYPQEHRVNLHIWNGLTKMHGYV